jgi:hypothetical protein
LNIHRIACGIIRGTGNGAVIDGEIQPAFPAEAPAPTEADSSKTTSAPLWVSVFPIQRPTTPPPTTTTVIGAADCHRQGVGGL